MRPYVPHYLTLARRRIPLPIIAFTLNMLTFIASVAEATASVRTLVKITYSIESI